jgi:hypothetical protein
MAPCLLIEFVPKSDPQCQSLLRSRQDIFDQYSEEAFLQSFGKFFCVEKRCQLGSSGRTLFMFRRLDQAGVVEQARS